MNEGYNVKGQLIKYLLCFIVLLGISFFCIQKTSAYFQFTKTASTNFTMATYQNLSLATDRETYGLCGRNATILLTVGNTNAYNMGYTITFSNNGLTYTIDGAAATTYTLPASGSKTHEIVVNGTTTTQSLTITVTPNSPYGSIHNKVVTFDLVCPVCTWGGVNSTNQYLKNGVTSTYTIDCTDASGITSDNLTSSAFTVSNTTLASVSGVTKSAITNGYRYTVSLLGKTGNGNVTISLKANTVKDTNLNGNALKTSGSIIVDNTAPALVLDKEGVVEGFKGWDLGSVAVIDENGYLGFTSETSAISYYYQVAESYYYWTFEATATSASTKYTPNGGWYTGTNYYDANFEVFTGSNGNSGNGQANPIPLNTWKSATASNYNYGEGLEYFRIRLRGTSPYANITTKYRNFKMYGNIFAKSKYTIKVTASDANNVVLKKYASGSQTAAYFTSGGTTFTGNNFDVTSNGTYTVYLKDTAGNETVQTMVINKIDNAAPVISSFAQNSAWGTTNTLTATATDSLAGIVAYAFTSTNVEPTSWTRVNNTTSAETVTNTVSSNGTYYVWFVDAAGNVSSSSTSVNKIDTGLPSCSWGTISNVTATTTKTFDITCTDTLSGMQSATLTTSNFVSSDTSKATVTSVSAPVSVTNGYKYTVTTTGVAAGTFTLSLNAGSVRDNATNSNAIATSGTISVVRSTASMTVSSATSSLTYGGSTGSVTYTYSGNATPTVVSSTPGVATVSINTTTKTITITPVTAGTATITLNAGQTNQYNAISKTVAVTVAKRTVTYKAADASKTYDGTALTNASGCSITSGSLASGHAVTCTNTGTITNKGTATNTLSTVVIKSGSTDLSSNYAITKTNGTLTVSARAVTITAGTSSRAYNGAALTNAGCTGNNLVSGHTVTCTMTTASTVTNAGSATNTISTRVIYNGSTDVTSNYTVTNATGTLTVSKKSVAVTWGETTAFTYNGGAQAPTASAASGVTGETLNITRTTATNYQASAYTSTASISSVSGGQALASNYTLTGTTKTFTIAQRPVTYKANNASKTYDGTALTNASGCTLTAGTLVSGHAVTCTNTGTITNKGTATNTLSTVVIKSGATDVSSNYAITKTNGTLTISARAVTVTAGSTSRDYNGSALTNTTCTGNNLVSGHAVTCTMTAASTITNVGSVANTISTRVIKSGSTDVTSNYTVTNATGTLTVNKRVLTPSATADDKIYDGSTATICRISLANAVSGQSPTATASGTFANATAGTGKTVTCSSIQLGSNWTANYNLSTTSVTTTATISKVSCNLTLSATSVSTPAGSSTSFTEKSTNCTGNFANSSNASGRVTVSPTSYSSVATNTTKTVTVNGVAVGSATLTVTFTPNDTTNYTGTSKTLTASVTDSTPPSCSWETLSNSYLKSGTTATYTLSCTDTQSGIATSTLSASSFTLSSAIYSIGTITSTAITNGYRYTLTITGGSGNGTAAMTLKGSAVKDGNNNGNVAVTSREIVVDNAAPTASFSPNGNTIYAKSHSTIVGSSEPTTTAKYLWTQTNGAGAASGTNFTPGSSISKSSGNGNWYLCVYLVDSLGNSSNTCSGAFSFDNEAPTITPSTTAICLKKGSTDNLANFVAITDGYSGVNYSTLSIKYGSTAYTNLSGFGVGNYTITYNVSDNLGNVASEKYIIFQVYSKIVGDQAIVTSGDGLYNDSLTAGRYIFKGTSPNNYITYNGQTWRILSIEADGTYKIIYDGIYSSGKYHSSNTNLETYASTTMNTTLNTTFYNAMTSAARSQLVAHNFDSGTVGYGASSTGVTIAATVSQEKTRAFNGYVALPTITDYLRASTSCTDATTWNVLNNSPYACKNTNWMYISSTTYYVLNPYSATRIRYENTSGAVSYNTVSENRGIRPVVYLKESTTFTGNGTSGSPYSINTSCSASNISPTTCTISTTSGYETSKVLTINPSSTSGISYSWDNSSFTATRTRTITSGGVYTGYIRDSALRTNRCAITIASRNEYQHQTCSSCKSCNYCSTGVLCGTRCYYGGTLPEGQIGNECNDDGGAYNSCNGKCYYGATTASYGTSCSHCGCNTWNTSDTTWYTNSCGSSNYSTCKNSSTRTTIAPA